MYNSIFIITKRDFLKKLNGIEREIMEMSNTIETCEEYDFDHAYNLLFSWCQNLIKRI